MQSGREKPRTSSSIRRRLMVESVRFAVRFSFKNAISVRLLEPLSGSRVYSALGRVAVCFTIIVLGTGYTSRTSALCMRRHGSPVRRAHSAARLEAIEDERSRAGMCQILRFQQCTVSSGSASVEALLRTRKAPVYSPPFMVCRCSGSKSTQNEAQHARTHF